LGQEGGDVLDCRKLTTVPIGGSRLPVLRFSVTVTAKIIAVLVKRLPSRLAILANRLFVRPVRCRDKRLRFIQTFKNSDDAEVEVENYILADPKSLGIDEKREV
jgi:hypothetical protein